MTRTIGTVTTYCGERQDEHPYLRGYKVRIVAVIKGAARPDYDPEADVPYLKDDLAIEQHGGVTAGDRVEVVPWIEKEGRYSFVTSDPRAIDLECYEGLVGQAD